MTSRGLCYLQSGTMQIFELGGSWLWTAIFSFEVARFGCKSLSEALVNRVTRAQSSINRPGIFSPHEIYKRRTLFFYHLGSFVWITVPTVLLFSLGASGPAGNWCWTSSSDWIMYSYICLWLEFFVILVASIVVSRLVFKTRAKQHNHDNQARLVDIVIAQRLMLVPLMYILLHVPGTIRRLDKIWGKPAGDTTKFLQGICDPSQGTVNLISMLIIDRNLRKELVESFCKCSSSIRCQRREDWDEPETSVISMGSTTA